MSSFTIKDAGDSKIFQITSANSEWIFYSILVILALCGAGLVAYKVITRRKPKNKFYNFFYFKLYLRFFYLP